MLIKRNIMRLHSHRRSNRGLHTTLFLFLSPRRAPEDCGTLWRKPGLSLDLGSYSWLRLGTHWHGMSHLQNNSFPWHKLEEWHCQVVTLCIVERGRRYMTRSWTQQMRTGWEEWEQDGAESGLDRRGQDSTCQAGKGCKENTALHEITNFITWNYVMCTSIQIGVFVGLVVAAGSHVWHTVHPWAFLLVVRFLFGGAAGKERACKHKMCRQVCNE